MIAAMEQLIADRPSFHAWPDGTPANWSVAPAVLRFIAEQLFPGMHTLETGAGQTTVAFAIAGTHHVSVTPEAAQADRIRAYLDRLAIKCNVTFILESSDVALPAGKGIPKWLDFVLIDGAHRFPFPILDWYYTQDRVPVGGIVAVDDFVMPSVRILHDFLMTESDWELMRAFQVTAFFRRVKRTENVWDWADQAINKPHLDLVRKRTEREQSSGKPSHSLLNWARSRRRK
jgi:predicted O-methyltransferase YrrM